MIRRVALLAIATTMLGAAACTSPDPLVAEGEQVASSRGCVSCHSTDGSKSVGPTWEGLYGSAVKLSDGTTVKADDAYLQESMRDPSAKTVKGFPAGTMERVIPKGSLSDEDVAALIAYIRSLDQTKR